jgi:deoxyribonuclease-4
MIHYFGPHLHKQTSILNTLKIAKNQYGASSLQIFVGNPRSGRMSQKTFNQYKDESVNVRKYLQDNNMRLVIHSPYVFNFSRDANTQDPFWINELWHELCLSQELGSIGCVLHMGKAVGLKKEIAEKNMIDNISIIVNKMKLLNMTTKLIIETSAGQGTELFTTENNSIEPLIRLWNSFTKEQQLYVGFCIDTCHIHSAGYNINTNENIDKLFNDFDKSIGLNNLLLIHLNNSSTKYNSHVDRHGTLTDGSISTDCLLYFATKSFTNNIPIILETTGDFLSETTMLSNLSQQIQHLPHSGGCRLLPSSIIMPSIKVDEKLIMNKDIDENKDVDNCECCENLYENENHKKYDLQNSNIIMLIDLGYLFHYRYHATKRNMMFAYKNRPDEIKDIDDNMIHDTFFSHLHQQLQNITKKYKITKNDIFFCKDDRKHNFWRTKLYPEYKANRGTADDLCLEWQAELYNVVKNYGNFLELEECEADDIIYLLSKSIIKKYPNKQIYILASDKDYFQILDRPTIKLIDGSGKETIGTNPNNAKVHLWTKILTGDNSDNIPPVIKGCGPKTAEKLINDKDMLINWVKEKDCFEQIKFNRSLISFKYIPSQFTEIFNKLYSIY